MKQFQARAKQNLDGTRCAEAQRRVEQNNALRQKLCQEIQAFSAQLDDVQPPSTVLQKVMANNYRKMIACRQTLLRLL